MPALVSTILTFSIALAFLRLMDFFAHRGWIESRLSRKLIHIGTGPIFVLCWLLYPDVPAARWLAALVPFAITAQFTLVGFGLVQDQAAVQAMSRSGDRREILRGPLYYGIMFILMTILFWKDSPAGITALMIMCGGDGIADLVGRRFNSKRLFYNPQKTMAGSVSVFIGGWVLSTIILTVFVRAGIFEGSVCDFILPLTIISLVSMLVESLPFRDLDNLTVTASAAILGLFLF
jgi:phytol kinase